MLNSLVGLISALPTGFAGVAGVWVAALLTLAVLSYVLGSNPAFRLAEHLFVGVAAGYAASLAWNGVLWPRLQLFMGAPARYWHYGLFFALGLMLLARGVKPIAVMGSLPLGMLFGVGAALALGGALTGSLVPQMQVSVVSLRPQDHAPGPLGIALAVDAFLVVLGTLSVLSVFHFATGGRTRAGALWRGILGAFGGLGRGLIMVTVGGLVAGAELSFFSVLSSRVSFLVNVWGRLLAQVGL